MEIEREIDHSASPEMRQDTTFLKSCIVYNLQHSSVCTAQANISQPFFLFPLLRAWQMHIYINHRLYIFSDEKMSIGRLRGGRSLCGISARRSDVVREMLFGMPGIVGTCKL